MARLSLSLLALTLIGVGAVAGEPQAPQGAANQPNEVLFKKGYAEIIYDPEAIPTLGLRVGIKTLLLLPADEKIVRVEVGVRGSALEIKYGQNWAAIRPNVEKLSTNVHIATDRGSVYSFDLVEGAAKEPHKKVIILRPDMDLDGDAGAASPAPRPANAQSSNAPQGVQTQSGRTVSVDDLGAGRPSQAGAAQGSSPQAKPTDQAAAAKLGTASPLTANVQNVPGVPGAELVRRLDKDYRISNGKPKLCAVESVFNDGQRTFVVFSSAVLEAPLFYRQTADGKREILTYRIEPAKDHRDKDIFMIPQVVDAGIVKLGDAETTFSWRKIHG